MNSTLVITDSRLLQTGEDKLNPLMSKFKRISCDQLEHVWNYLGKVLLIVRNFLNAAARNVSIVRLAGKDFPHKVLRLTTYMKLASIVSVPFGLLAIKSALQKIFSSILLRDKEGVALAFLSLTIISADTFDSLTTFVNSVLGVFSIKPVAAFSVIGLPIAFGIAGLGTLSRIVQIVKASLLYRSMDLDPQTIRNFLEAKLGISEEELKLLDSQDPSTLEKIEKLKEKKKAALLRSAPKEAVEELEAILSMLNKNPLDDSQTALISEKLIKVQKLLQKKMKIDLLGILANAVILSALVLVSIGTGGALPFILIMLSFIIRILTLIYQDLKNK